MMTIEDICSLGDRALRDVDRVRSHPYASLLDPAVTEAVEAAYRSVEEAAADPVRLGFAGGFSTGKSVLLGALFGYPGLLPASQPATTAVITEIHPRPGVQVQVDPTVRVHYIDGEVALAYRTGLIEALREDAADRGLPGPAGHSWRELTDWCANVLWPRADNGRIREFIALRDAWIMYEHLIGSAPVEREWTRVREGLLVNRDESGPVPAWQLPSPVGPAASAEADLLRGSSRLVERVVLGLEVPVEFWPLDRTQLGDDLVVIDTPGRGAAPAKVRDALLLECELPRLDALVILGDPQHPDAVDVPELQRAYAKAGGRGGVVVINAFDRDTSASSRLDSGAGALTEADIFADPAYAGLAAAWRTGTEGGSNTGDGTAARLHDVAIISVVTAWALGAEGPPPPVPCPSGVTVGDWRQQLQARAAAWGALASRVPGQHGVAGALGDYAADGGLSRLRRLVTVNAARRGLARKAGRVQALVEELAEQVASAQAALADLAADAAEVEQAGRNALEQLIKGRVPDALGRSKSRAEIDVFTPAFRLPNGRTSAEEVSRRVLDDVYSWPCWGLLWDSVVDRELRPGGLPVPTTADDLLAPFVRSVQAARGHGADVADDTVNHWLALRDAELAELFQAVVDALEPIPTRIREEHVALRRWLGRAVQMGWIDDDPGLAVEGADDLRRRGRSRCSRCGRAHPCRGF
jgi:hypothetical protein